MKILITGANGFIGSHIVEYLLNKYPSFRLTLGVHSQSNKTRKSAKEIVFDLTNPESYNNLLNQDYDVLIHLAWKDIHSYDSDHHINILLKANELFLAKAMSRCKSISITGTCLEYGLLEGELSESMECSPITKYGIAKNLLRKFIFQESRKSTTNIQWLRIFYTFGRGQASSSLIPQLEEHIKNGNEQFNMSGGQQVRDYLAVDKLSQYIVELALNKTVSGIFNCSSNQPLQLETFVRNYIAENHPTKKIKLNLGFYQYHLKEPMRFWGNNRKLLEVLYA